MTAAAAAATGRPDGAAFLDSAMLTVVLSSVYPTAFVLSQNWYALETPKGVAIIAAAVLFGYLLFAIASALSWLVQRLAALAGARSHDARQSISSALLALACTGAIFFLLISPLKHAVPSAVALTLLFMALAVLFGVAFARGGARYLNIFLGLLTSIAGATWISGSLLQANSLPIGAKQDFESAAFAKKPNVYLFIYDAYGSRDAYGKVFAFDNDAHYRDLEKRGFEVRHTLSNYDSTWQTTMSVFQGAHHYFKAETGNQDTVLGRPMMSGITHNPTLATFRANGYGMQYIHGFSYFVNETGILDHVFPKNSTLSALRVFDNPVLNRWAGRKRHVQFETQTAELYARLPPMQGDVRPWFTFAHVNLPGHGPGLSWLQQASFEQKFRDRTHIANTHMIDTIDRIIGKDPTAVIAIFGDHGAMRYNLIWGSGDPNKGFADAGVSTDVVTLDRYGVMIAVHSGGNCDAVSYPTITPINLMRSIFACLSGDPTLVEARADDITLFGGAKGALRIAGRDGKPLSSWNSYSPR